MKVININTHKEYKHKEEQWAQSGMVRAGRERQWAINRMCSDMMRTMDTAPRPVFDPFRPYVG